MAEKRPVSPNKETELRKQYQDEYEIETARLRALREEAALRQKARKTAASSEPADAPPSHNQRDATLLNSARQRIELTIPARNGVEQHNVAVDFDMPITIISGETNSAKNTQEHRDESLPSVIVDKQYMRDARFKEEMQQPSVIVDETYSQDYLPTDNAAAHTPQAQDRLPQSKTGRFRKFISGLALVFGLSALPNKTEDNVRPPEQTTLSQDKKEDPSAPYSEQAARYTVPNTTIGKKPVFIKDAPQDIAATPLNRIGKEIHEAADLNIREAVHVVRPGEGFYVSARDAVNQLRLDEKETEALKAMYPKFSALDKDVLVEKIILTKGKELGYGYDQKGGFFTVRLFPGAEIIASLHTNGHEADINFAISEQHTETLSQPARYQDHIFENTKAILSRQLAEKFHGNKRAIKTASALIEQAAKKNVNGKKIRAAKTEMQRLTLEKQRAQEQAVYDAAVYIMQGVTFDIATMRLNKDARNILQIFHKHLTKEKK